MGIEGNARQGKGRKDKGSQREGRQGMAKPGKKGGGRSRQGMCMKGKAGQKEEWEWQWRGMKGKEGHKGVSKAGERQVRTGKKMHG